ncbi:MAG: DUF58 domain-containing protein [bacterium]
MQTSEILKQVRRIEIKTGRLVSETFGGEYLSVFKGRGMEFAEVREYAPGDDVRSIDWNVTARLGRPFVKRYVEERELTVVLACDVSGSQHFGTGAKYKNEAAAEISALFAFSALRNNDKVGLALFTDTVELFIPPRKGRTHVLRLIRELLAHEPQRKKTDIGAALSTLNRVLKRRGILVLISDFLDSGFEHPFRLSAKKHDLIPVVVEDPREISLPPAGAVLRALDPETGVVCDWDISSEKFLKAYASASTQKKKNLEKLFKPLGLEWITVNSDGPIFDPVVKFFRQRAKRFR